jgi:hypothetical protein
MKAEVEWDGYFWVATPEGQRGVTQAKRLEQLGERLSEVVHLMSGEIVAPDDWDLVIHYGDLGVEAEEVRRERAELEEAEQRLVEQTRNTVRALRDSGMSFRDIGTLTGITHQRAHQLVDSTTD